MAHYTSPDDLINVLSEKEQSQLTDDVIGDGAEPNSAILDAALRQAESVVNSYIGVRYDVPLEEPSDAIIYAVLSIAKYILFSRRSFMMPEYISDDRGEVVKWLKDVSVGNLVLTDEAAKEVSTDAFTGFGTREDAAFNNNLFS